MTFRVGQEVVCVDDSAFGFLGSSYLDYPVKGTVYVVQEIFNGGQSLTLRGMEKNRWGVRAVFFCSRFRPIVKTDISIFTAMLAPAPKKRVRTDA
jgi:hypothetical protein